eukprot:7191340-Karenia_brevis.AAC.1
MQVAEDRILQFARSVAQRHRSGGSRAFEQYEPPDSGGAGSSGGGGFEMLAEGAQRLPKRWGNLGESKEVASVEQDQSRPKVAGGPVVSSPFGGVSYE